MADPKWFTPKCKPTIYNGAFVELYNWWNQGQVYGINKIVKFEKIRVLIAENFCNLGTYQIIEISLFLCSVYVVPKDQDKFLFYINNYID